MSSYIEFFVARRGEKPIKIFCSTYTSSIYRAFSAPHDSLKKIESDDLAAIRDYFKEEIELIEKNLKALTDERTQVINSSISIQEKGNWLSNLCVAREDYEDAKEGKVHALEFINFLDLIFKNLTFAREDEFYDLLVGIDVCEETLENYKALKI